MLVLIAPWWDINAQSVKQLSDLFNYNKPFKITISYDFRELDKDNDELAYIPGKISYNLEDSTWIEKSIRIRPRGNSRRDQCQHPPLRIDFSDSLYGIDLFDHWNKMKLVSVCLQSRNYNDYLIREYLIYKAYEKLTDVCFKTYFLNITFRDIGTGKRSYDSPGFFIEDISDLTKRLNATEINALGIGPSELDTLSFDRMALFQYMIGNTDWYIQNVHNIKLIKLNDFKKVKAIPVPYDFDYAGLVNATYAVPHENIPIHSVRERYFMGVCRKEAHTK